MVVRKSTGSCWNNNSSSTRGVEKKLICPKCKFLGKRVSIRTVKHLVVGSQKNRISNDDYFICVDEKCDVVYYDENYEETFLKEDIKVPIWFKEDADPKYVCYCSNVTEEEIIEAVVNKNAKSLKEIVKLTGAMKNCNCEINNPLGVCCSPYIQEVIDKVL